MTTALEQAFVPSTNQVQTTVRAKLAEQMVGVFDTPNLSAEDFSIQPWRALAIYGPDGDLVFYSFDAGDTVTADDGGVSCIVVSGRRYKRQSQAFMRDSALSGTTAAQPVSPSIGDTYILPVAPSGDDWAGQAKTIATFTARDWIFREPFIGMIVYVEDEQTFYHFDANGDWQSGLPIGAISDGSIPPKKLVDPFAIMKVEGEQNAPPVSPTTGVMYQVGLSPTGAWASNAKAVARWNAAGAWEFFTPVEGDTIYRKDVKELYTYRSGAWGKTSSSSVVVQTHVGNVGSSANTLAITNRWSSPSITAKVGQKIRVVAFVEEFIASYGGDKRLGIRVDSSSVLAVSIMTIANTFTLTHKYFTVIGEVSVPDASAHTYHLATIGSIEAVAATVTNCVFDVMSP